MWDWLIKYGLQLVLASLFGALTLYVKRRVGRMKAVEAGVRVMLKERIYNSYDKYMELGYCPVLAREIILEMHKEYHALGGNGTADCLVERMMDLPTEKGGLE